MKTNRLIAEKYWSQFIRVDSKTGKTIHDGHKFEELIEYLLSLMFHEIEWEPTQITHDGNKDFKAKNGEEIYWAECKNYKSKIDLKTLATTLVMAEIENVNSIFFFCYSEINNNTKTKLNSFSKSNQKTIFFFDGIVLDQLILKYQDKIIPQFFPDLQEQRDHMDFFQSKSEPIVLCYFERNPFFCGTPEFDMQNLTELQYLKLGEIIGIHIIIINTNLTDAINCSIDLTLPKLENYFEILDDEMKRNQNSILYSNIGLPAGSTFRKSIYLKLCSWAPKVSLPQIKCKFGKKVIRKFNFPMLSTLKTRQTAFLGSNYVNEVNVICKGCINQKRLSVIYIYGSSGTGKSRMMSECSARFISQGYQVVRLMNSERNKFSTFIMLKELIFSLYGFSDEIIEHIINNSYETLENYNCKSYKEIFRIINIIYNNRYSLSQIEELDYSIIFEKMAKGKYFFIADDIQYWDSQAVSFLKDFNFYALSMQRKCNAVIGIAANTDILYNNNTIEFLAELVSKNNSYNENIYPYNLTGFETKNQSYLFLKEILGIDDDFNEIENLSDFSLKPKYITEVANYLQDINAIEVVHNKVVIADKTFFNSSLKKIPVTIQTILEKRWSLFIENAGKEEIFYKNIVSSILFLGNVGLSESPFGKYHRADIELLLRHGFLKKAESKDNIYVFEHDSIKYYLKEYYKDWFETAVSYLKNPEHNFIKGQRLESICDLYVSKTITEEDYYNYRDSDYSDEIKNKMNERILYFILQNGVENFYVILQDILHITREQFGEKRAEYFYEIFEEQYDTESLRLTCQEYCTIMMEYAENQLKLKSTEKAIKVYDLVLRKIDGNPIPNKEHLVSRIDNRYFVCGRVGSAIHQYSEKWDTSMQVALKNHYFDICIENYFDKAHSFFLDSNAFEKAIENLENGCKMYEKYKPQGLRGQYLYRDVQLSFLKKDYKLLKSKIWKYDEEIAVDDQIQFKLYFRIQFLIFKITFGLMGEKEYSDFEMENMLEQLNVYQTMQNKLQLYRYLYLCGKYYTKKGAWEKAYLVYKKTFDNLEQNRNTEEIRLQRMFIAQDMIINFRKGNFSFNKYDMSFLTPIINGTPFERLMVCSDKDFSEFFNSYIPLTPISNELTKAGFLLF